MENVKEDFLSIEDEIDDAFKTMGEIDKELLEITEMVEDMISEVDTMKIDFRK